MIRDPRMTVSFVFGLVGGVLILTGGLALLPAVFAFGFSSGSFFSFGPLMAIVAGVLVIIGAVMAFGNPSQGVIWGIVTVVFGAISILGGGGFIVGMALSITGGALAIAFGSSGPGFAAGGQRACLGCGMLIDRDFAHCPHCGHVMSPPAR